MNARVIVEPASFRLGQVGPSTGEIWLAMGDVAFPSKGWNDFVVVILAEWLDALSRILRESSALERVHFMEGPYEVQIRPFADSSLELTALESGAALTQARTDAADFAADLLKTADVMVEICKQAGDVSADAQRLERALAAMNGLTR